MACTCTICVLFPLPGKWLAFIMHTQSTAIVSNLPKGIDAYCVWSGKVRKSLRKHATADWSPVLTRLRRIWKPINTKDRRHFQMLSLLNTAHRTFCA